MNLQKKKTSTKRKVYMRLLSERLGAGGHTSASFKCLMTYARGRVVFEITYRAKILTQLLRFFFKKCFFLTSIRTALLYF